MGRQPGKRQGSRSAPGSAPAGESSSEPGSALEESTDLGNTVVGVPVLAEGADPGRFTPSPAAIRDRLLVDRRLVEDHAPERLFAYDVTPRAMKHLRGLVAPGDRIVFRRGGRVGPDRICAVRTDEGVVLSRVRFKDRSLLLLPGEGERDFDSLEMEGEEARPGAIAGTHVLLIRR